MSFHTDNQLNSLENGDEMPASETEPADVNNESDFIDGPFLIKPQIFEDERGFLTVMENILPFKIERIYWIYGADKQSRGGHRHKITKQALVSVAGTVDIKINDGKKEKNIYNR